MDNYSYDAIRENIRIVYENIHDACAKYRDDGSKVEIMAVTKTVPPEVVNWIFDFGLELMGENRVQEYLAKKDSYAKETSFGAPPKIHFIGHLQTNKVKYIIDDMDMIQTVDSLKLAQEINRLAAARNKIMNVLCEVNIGGEESKNGISGDEVLPLLEQLSQLPSIRVKGLMTIPPPTDSDVFLGRMEELFNKIKDKNIEGIEMTTLSMGMTHDYVDAVKHGSTIVRIGTGIFGARNYK